MAITAPTRSYSLNEASGATRAAQVDQAGIYASGSMSETAASVGNAAGKVGNAADIVKTDTKGLETGTYTRLAGAATNLSFSFMFKLSSSGDNVLVSGITGGATILDIRFFAGAAIIYVRLGGTQTYKVSSSFSTTGWNHLVVTYDGGVGTATSRCLVYHDGVLVTGMTNGSWPTSLTLGTAKLCVGSYNSTHTWSDSLVDEFHIWEGHTLSAAEALELATAELAGTGYPWSAPTVELSGSGTLRLTGGGANLSKTTSLSSVAATLQLTGSTAELAKRQGLSGTATLSLAGGTADLEIDGPPLSGSATLRLSGGGANLAKRQSMSGAPGRIVITGSGASLNRRRAIAATAALLRVQGSAPALSRVRSMDAVPAVLNLTGRAATLGPSNTAYRILVEAIPFPSILVARARETIHAEPYESRAIVKPKRE